MAGVARPSFVVVRMVGEFGRRSLNLAYTFFRNVHSVSIFIAPDGSSEARRGVQVLNGWCSSERVIISFFGPIAFSSRTFAPTIVLVVRALEYCYVTFAQYLSTQGSMCQRNSSYDTPNVFCQKRHVDDRVYQHLGGHWVVVQIDSHGLGLPPTSLHHHLSGHLGIRTENSNFFSVSYVRRCIDKAILMYKHTMNFSSQESKERENGWTWVIGKKNRHLRTNRNPTMENQTTNREPAINSTTFYSTNFPFKWNYLVMKDVFSNYGQVADVYIAGKRNKHGKRFGFMRFLDVSNPINQEIRTSTSSMTSVPKPLKFLRPHYGTLKSFYESMPESDLKKLLADTLSVLALTMYADGEPLLINQAGSLQIHFRQGHFLCEDEACLSKKFVVFNSEGEMKKHNVLEHRGRMSRSKRNAILQLETVLSCDSSPRPSSKFNSMLIRKKP
ncbi:hypothetical protein CTI12_AA249380 [Artemisia annua]|uniref:Uncharacterized protein n=1 Tax=Artemisia annua TaxID=35608 RepID=A0A2U1MBF9_ARTAN|nr:hypothetical protein CTI12_AA249380 [Artemisia annua]